MSQECRIIEQMFDMIPLELDEMQPGPVLAGFLAAINVAEVSGYDRIVVLRAQQRMASHYTAAMYEAMAAVSDSLDEEEEDPQLATESAAAEIRVALALTRRAADSELSFALDLRRRLPRVWQLLATGAIDVRRAKTITYGTAHLSIGIAREVVEEVIDAAPRLTTGQLAARLRRLSIVADPEDAKRRYCQAVRDRRVTSEPTESGTANLFGLDLPPDRVAAITRRINRLARGLRTTGESRTIDQLRADVMLDLLGGTTTTGGGTGQGMVDIRVDLDTLTGLSESPGELAGYGPVIADIARQVTDQQHNSQWRYAVTDPNTGQVLNNGTTRRRPTTAQRRTVETRDPTCVFPGCRMSATDCDLDHRTPYSEHGPTTITNLGPLCRHDHRIRRVAGWTYQPLPNGDHQWTTKLGHIYTTSGRSP